MRLPPRQRDRARALRRDQTEAERQLWHHLRARRLGGLRFRRQHPVGRYFLDFYCPAARLAVELDGSQHFEDAGLERDEARTTALARQGIRVLRYTNREIDRALADVLEDILAVARARTEAGRPS